MEPIPIPPRQQWRDFRFRWLPLIVFLAVLSATLWIWRTYLGSCSLVGEVESVQVQACSPITGLLAEWKVRSFQRVAATQVMAIVISNDPKTPGAVVAPIDGNVTYIYRQPGEKVVAGEPLATVGAASADRIVAFLRQPLRIEPCEGWPVLIRPRARQKPVQSRIEKVGPQLVPIRPSLLPAAQVRVELGLPLIIAVPQALKLHPGEVVDLTLMPPPGTPAPPVRQHHTATNAVSTNAAAITVPGVATNK